MDVASSRVSRAGTPELLECLRSFDPRIVRLAGTEEVEKALSAFGAYRAIPPLGDGDYTVDRSAGTYSFDRDGSFLCTLNIRETKEIPQQKIERLLAI